MPTVKVKYVDYALDGNYRKDLSENPDIIEFKKGLEYENQTDEEILDILISKAEESLNSPVEEEKDELQTVKEKLYQKYIGIYEREYGEIKDSTVSKEEYVYNKLQGVEENFYKEPEYLEAVEKSLKEKEGKDFTEQKTKSKEEVERWERLQGVKNTISGRKAQVADVLKAREDLAKDYYKTSLGSRIARWFPFIPRSWSKAGRIQDQLDKIDKAIKDAGFEKKDIENIKKEMKAEKPAVENNNLENQVEVSSGLNGPKTTEDVILDLESKTVQSEANKIKSQAVDNSKNLQKEEIIAE